MQAAVSSAKAKGLRVGFVPTMGALHQGHLSLVQESVASTDFTVVSIFVNPIQFNNPQDLKTYPRTLEEDLQLLERAGCHAVFAPEESEMYPKNEEHVESYNFGNLEQVMEGAFRLGHFNGVAVVVRRLFGIVQPDVAFFGLKDFQQVAVIKELVRTLSLPLQIQALPTVRESDGLAMSSRNVRLSAQQRKQAVAISHTLFWAEQQQRKISVQELKNIVTQKINAHSELQVEYAEIVNQTSLQPLQNWTDEKAALCVAVTVGEVRLIDNILL